MAVVVVTGGARGQGAAHGERFARAGDHVYLTDVIDDVGAAAVEQINAAGGRATYRHLDVASDEEWQALAAEIAAGNEPVRVLINNAGIPQRVGRVLDLDPAEWNRILSINLTGAFLGIRAIAPLIVAAGGGTIINVGSSAALTGNPKAAYTSAKWAMRGLTKAAAFDLAASGVRVNCIHPGIVPTPMMEGALDSMEVMRQHTPISRVAAVEEIAEIVYFLASDAASYLTGIDLPIDGGFVDLGVFFNMIRATEERAAAGTEA